MTATVRAGPAPAPLPGSAGTPALLERMLSLDALRWAWRRVRENGGAAGGDEVTLRRFERLLDRNLLALADEVRSGAYVPGRPRFVTIQTRGKSRRLAILPIRDRVLQRAALDLLTPMLDPTFLPSSFGYRPGRSLHDAVERIVHLRDRGLTWVVDADIHTCFASLDHRLLGEFLERSLPDPALRALIGRWIAGSPRPARASPLRPSPPPSRVEPARPRGIHQGAPISPLLCNVYLHRMDAALKRRRFQVVRYADDFVLLCKSREHAEHGRRAVEKVLSGLELALNPGKTRLTGFDEGFTFLGVEFQGSDFTYVSEQKRIVVDTLPPEWFHYLAEGAY